MNNNINLLNEYFEYIFRYVSIDHKYKIEDKNYIRINDSLKKWKEDAKEYINKKGFDRKKFDHVVECLDDLHKNWILELDTEIMQFKKFTYVNRQKKIAKILG